MIMTDFFGTDLSGFDAFWSAWPDRRNKETARKAFAKLRPADRQKATDHAAKWAAQWRKENPQASHIHAATYINQKRWTDLEEAAPPMGDDSLAMQAQWIKDGKSFLARTIKPSAVAEMLARGMVTPEECARAGV